MLNARKFRDKNVPLVDDSTCVAPRHRISIHAREAGAKKVYLASAAP